MPTASATANVGSNGYGQWRITLTQTSQDWARNVSVVRVQGFLVNNGSFSTYNNTAIPKNIYGSFGWSGSGGFNVGANSSLLYIDQSFEVAHDAAGYKTVSVGVSYGNTGTNTFGTGGAVQVDLTLDRIPKPPDPPSVHVDGISATGAHAYLTAPANDNGLGIDAYETYILSNNAWPDAGGNVVASAPTYGVYATNLVHSTRYYMTGRAHNGMGWSGWATMGVIDTLNVVPSAPGTPTLTNVMPTTLTVSWAASTDNGGSAIDSYLLRYWDVANPTAYVDHSSANNLTREVTGLIPGKTYGFVVFAHNAVGYSVKSAESDVQMLAGVWVNVAGVWKLAIPYVNVDGVWKMAVPYVNVNGVWKMTN